MTTNLPYNSKVWYGGKLGKWLGERRSQGATWKMDHTIPPGGRVGLKTYLYSIVEWLTLKTSCAAERVERTSPATSLVPISSLAAKPRVERRI